MTLINFDVISTLPRTHLVLSGFLFVDIKLKWITSVCMAWASPVLTAFFSCSVSLSLSFTKTFLRFLSEFSVFCSRSGSEREEKGRSTRSFFLFNPLKWLPCCIKMYQGCTISAKFQRKIELNNFWPYRQLKAWRGLLVAYNWTQVIRWHLANRFSGLIFWYFLESNHGKRG